MKAPQQQQLPSPARRRSREQAPDTVILGPAQNFSKMPNEYALLLAGHKLAGTLQRDILFCILHHTWGAYPQQTHARMSSRQIAKYCDNEESSNVIKATVDLARRGIIEIQDPKGCGRTAKNYKLTPDRWKDAPAYEPPKLQQTAADPDEQPDEDEDDPIFPGTRNCSKLLIRPGCKPRPVAARLAPKDKDPVDFRIECSNTGFDPVEFSATTEADVLRISFQSMRRKSESVNSADDEKRPNKRRTDGANLRFTNRAQKANITDIQRLTDFQNSVFALLTQEFDKPFDRQVPADEKLLQSIFAAAGPDLPAAEFERYSRQEIKRAHKRRDLIGPGILRSLASQAAALPRPSAPSPTPANAPEPALASAEDVSELLDLCIICGGDGSGKFRGVATGKPCEPCNGTGRNPHAGGRPC